MGTDILGSALLPPMSTPKDLRQATLAANPESQVLGQPLDRSGSTDFHRKPRQIRRESIFTQAAASLSEMVAADKMPPPAEGEPPSAYADRVGRWYSEAVPDTARKDQGQFLTPVAVAQFMARLPTPSGRDIRILDPGAGAGILSISLCERLVQEGGIRSIRVEAYENDFKLARLLQQCARYTESWAKDRGVDLSYHVVEKDFVLSHTTTPAARNDDGFAITISNPPYFKLSKSDPRVQAASAVVHGQPNIYALFMSLAASLLAPEGQLVFITPRSYATGPYFRLFRERFFASMKPTRVHLFGSRREAFSHDGVLQENVILHATRSNGWAAMPAGSVIITHSDVSQLANASQRMVPLDEVLDIGRDFVLRIPTTEYEEHIIDLVHSWRESLASLGLKTSTGPVVPFRTNAIVETADGQAHAPLLWLQHVRPMSVRWPLPSMSKGQYIRVDKASKPLLVPNKTYVLMRRFSAKEEHRRLVAAPLLEGTLPNRFLGLENHLNYIYRPFGTLSEEEAFGLSALLNSRILDTYFRTSNGNTQVNAAELRAMPLPTAATVKAIGRQIKDGGAAGATIDRTVEQTLLPAHLQKLSEAQALG